jgi:hypothetical protein
MMYASSGFWKVLFCSRGPPGEFDVDQTAALSSIRLLLFHFIALLTFLFFLLAPP